MSLRPVATFLGSLPRISSGPGRDVHLLPVGPVPRVLPAQVPGAVPLFGSRRLEAAHRVARFATGLTVSVAEQGTTSWRDRPRVDAGLAWLSSSGRLGFDIDAGRWFHRELPVNADRILRDNPRLRSTRAITGLAHVSGSWSVPGTHAVHRVKRTGDRWVCTCPWEEEHHGTRGPCKHVLAVVLAQHDSAQHQNV